MRGRGVGELDQRGRVNKRFLPACDLIGFDAGRPSKVLEQLV